MQKILSEGSLTSTNICKFKEFLTLMSSELERCGKIVSGLLSFSRQIQIEYKTIELNEILDAVIRLVRHKIELQNIHLTTRLHAGVIMIRGNANRLQQTFLNLIFNAIEAMPGGGQLSILSQLDDTKHQLKIEIRDNGSGIAEEHLDHIFDPFFSTKKEGEGTGLGLSIVYGVVHNHGGKIRVISKEGTGTVFSLTFPVLQ
jgi:signal transduction histidine kinase